MSNYEVELSVSEAQKIEAVFNGTLDSAKVQTRQNGLYVSARNNGQGVVRIAVLKEES